MNSIAVGKGRDWLDANHTGWREKVNKDTLDLRLWSKCILGQVFGASKLPRDYPKALAEYGFTAQGAEENEMMVKLWKEVL